MGTPGGKGLSNITMHVATAKHNNYVCNIKQVTLYAQLCTRLHIFLYFKYFINHFGFTTE